MLVIDFKIKRHIYIYIHILIFSLTCPWPSKILASYGDKGCERRATNTEIILAMETSNQHKQM